MTMAKEDLFSAKAQNGTWSFENTNLPLGEKIIMSTDERDASGGDQLHAEEKPAVQADEIRIVQTADGGSDNVNSFTGVNIEKAQSVTKRRIFLIWTGGTIACVLRSELCGAEFATALNEILNRKDLPSDAGACKSIFLSQLSAIDVPQDRQEHKKKIFDLIEDAASSSKTDAMIRRLKMEMEVSVPGLTGEDFVRSLPQGLQNKYDFEIRNPFNTTEDKRPFGIDSTEMVPDMMEKIGSAVGDILRDPHEKDAGIVVAHGTDTMTNVAAYLAFRNALGLDRPIVFTGSQIRPGDSLTDAHNNFALALRASELNCGEVLVAFGERISRGAAASKSDSISKDGFHSPHQHSLATLTGTHLDENTTYFIPPFKAKKNVEASCPGVAGKSVIIKMDPTLPANLTYLQDAIFNPRLHDAVIIEGYAAGNIPTSIAHIIKQVSRDMLIIVTPSGATHGEPETLYEGSPDVSHPGTIFAKGMVSSVATLKFQWLYNRALEIGLSDRERRPLLDWVRSRYMFNFVNEGAIAGKKNAESTLSSPGFKRLLLYTGEPIDPTTITQTKYESLVVVLKRRWLENMARQLGLDGNDYENWIGTRENLDIPMETILNLWDSEENDPLWHDLNSPQVALKTIQNLDDVLRKTNPESQTVQINSRLARGAFVAFGNFVESIFESSLEKLKTVSPTAFVQLLERYQPSSAEDSAGSIETPSAIDNMKERVIYRSLMPGFYNDYLNTESISFSPHKIQSNFYSVLAGSDRELYRLLNEDIGNVLAEELPGYFETFVSGLLRSMVTEIMNHIMIDQGKKSESLEDFVVKKTGMKLEGLINTFSNSSIRNDIILQFDVNNLSKKFTLDIPTIRHTIRHILFFIFLRKSIGQNATQWVDPDPGIESELQILRTEVKEQRRKKDKE